MHGRISEITHDGSEQWESIPRRLEVTRYHSLTLDTDLATCLVPTAWTHDGVVMAMRHRDRPIWGVQFHPESIASEHGAQLLANFARLTERTSARRRRPRSPVMPAGADDAGSCNASSRLTVVPRRPARPPEPSSDLKVRTRSVAIDADPERFFRSNFSTHRHAFWLDSSLVEHGRSRFSMMGDASGERARVVEFDAASRRVRETVGDDVTIHDESIYTYLDRELARLAHLDTDVPFDLNCGFVGYFGYGLDPASHCTRSDDHEWSDAKFVLADRFVAFDHERAEAWLVSLESLDLYDGAATDAWFDEMETSLRRAAADRTASPAVVDRTDDTGGADGLRFRLERSREQYIADIEEAKDLLRAGESYEICLTNQITATAVPDPFEAYSVLRRVNPAPYAAFLKFGDMAVLSSSPERFLRVDQDRTAESKPIKGTRPRGSTPEADDALRHDLATSDKDRSENLMIVDLLRNDLGVVCDVGSVTVPSLMNVETYETVHQLVSTVRGTLRPGLGSVDCVRHAFPGGSMTGAPKLRTMGIIDRLENRSRGVYAGSIGFLAANGTADLNIVIRTVVQTPTATTIGTGGAIIMASDPDEEFDETMVKARAPIRALIAAHRDGVVDDDACESVIEQLRIHGEATI